MYSNRFIAAMLLNLSRVIADMSGFDVEGDNPPKALFEHKGKLF